MSSTARSLALVLAHPDDETYSAYGTVARHCTDPQFRLSVLHATDGEAGQIADGIPASPATLGAWRREEDRNGWRTLGRMPDRHIWLGLPDHGLERIGVPALTGHIAEFLRAERPDVVATFGPDGVTGHPDHIAVSAATTEAFHRVRADGGPGLRRLLYNCVPQSLFEAAQRWAQQNDRFVWDPQRLYHIRGVPDEQIGIVINNRSVALHMLAAIKQHRSQRMVLFDPRGTDAEWLRVLGRETWSIAWPLRPPGSPVLDSVFAELDAPDAQLVGRRA